MLDLPNVTINQFENSNTIWLALSGGMDSSCLLHYLSQQLPSSLKPKLKAIHINHQLQPDADYWQQHCQHFCDDLNVPLTTKVISVELQSGESLENCARIARYKVFAELLQPRDVLLLAHHQRDQAETLLLRLMRGAGTDGLAAMPISRSVGDGEILRPWLQVPATTIATYAANNSINFITDNSNNDINFDRNFMRHKVLPLLKQRWHGCERVLTRNAMVLQQQQQLLQQVAIEDLAKIENENGVIEVAALLTLDELRQQNVLRYWIKSKKLLVPSYKVLQRIKPEVLLARGDKNPVVGWNNAEIRRYRNQLFIMPPQQQFEYSDFININVNSQQIKLPCGSLLKLQPVIGSGIQKSLISNNLTVRYRQGGEWCRPYDRCAATSLKKIMQEYNIPPWARSKVPLIYVGDKLAACVPHFVCHEFAAVGSEPGIAFCI